MKQTFLRLLILGATISMVVAGCGVKHLVASSIEHGKAPVVIDGKAYAYGDELKMWDHEGGTSTGHFCGEVIDFSGKLFPERHFAIAASDPSRDCGAAVSFFRDFLKPGNSFDPGGYWRGMEVEYTCGGTSSGEGCSPYKTGYHGGFRAQTMNGTVTPYSKEIQGFRVMALAF